MGLALDSSGGSRDSVGYLISHRVQSGLWVAARSPSHDELVVSSGYNQSFFTPIAFS